MDLNDYLDESGNGTAAALARDINVSPVIISQWKTGRRPIPATRCPDIEKATGGLIRCEALRPDVDWGVVRNSHLRDGSDSPPDQRNKSNQTI